MILTKKLLIQWGACGEGINFCERNKLFGFDLDRIDEVKGDYGDFISWLKPKLNIKREYDSQGNKIKEENSFGNWFKWDYDSNGTMIKQENSDGCITTTETEIYPNGQLKRINNLYLPLV